MLKSLTQVVIFGASGDLTARKLIPALVRNIADGALDPSLLQVIGVSRSAQSSDVWRDKLEPWIPEEYADHWQSLRARCHYHAGNVGTADDVVVLAEHLDAFAREAGTEPDAAGRLYYLALKPSLFGPAVHHLEAAGLVQDDGAGWRRVVVEKPFGTDLASAQALNAELLDVLREDQILRIDHYLGKETVQNILAFRFQNAIFEPLWNRKHVESVEITVAESIGVEGSRGAYYDTAGALRDMVQNHVLQVLALVAMEPPSSMAADDVRDEKVKVLSALTPFSPEDVAKNVVRAQYIAGPSRDSGYLEEQGVPEGSSTETYVAIRAQIRNWRWNGVPFFLRTGKGLAKRYTEVVIRYSAPPVDLFGGEQAGPYCALRPNSLRLLIQPVEGIRLDFLVKQPGPGTVTRPAQLGFNYADMEGAGKTADAYQRLLLDAIEGNATLFIRGDEVEAAWRFADSIRAGWETQNPEVHTYPAGSYGPDAADGLFRGREGTWGRNGG